MEKWATFFNPQLNQSFDDNGIFTFRRLWNEILFNFFFLMQVLSFLPWFLLYSFCKILTQTFWKSWKKLFYKSKDRRFLLFFKRRAYIIDIQHNIYFHSNFTFKALLLALAELTKYNLNKSNVFSWRVNWRLTQEKLAIYKESYRQTQLVTFFSTYITYSYTGLIFLWKGLRLWLLPLIFGLSFVYYGMIIRVLPFNKVVFLWLSFFMVFYWLVSGFVFFFKKYQFGKYTSAIQRFWRRSYILFWLLESCLLLVFVYLTLIASQESFFMFDQIQLYKTHLFSWRLFLLKVFPIAILLILAYFFLLTVKWNVFSKHSLWLLFFTFILTYIIWLEFYQYFHISNFYGNLVWNYDIDEKLWSLDLEARRTRIVNHYMMWLLILKFWHLLFVYAFWLFFILRSWEKNTTKYTLLAANHQNLIILFIMSWLIMLPWIKIYFRKFFDIPYFWFYINNRTLFSRLFFNDLKVLWYGFINYVFSVNKTTSVIFNNIPFFYWIETNKALIFNQTRKHFMRNSVIELFIN